MKDSACGRDPLRELRLYGVLGSSHYARSLERPLLRRPTRAVTQPQAHHHLALVYFARGFET
jgi:hypothetical protein